VAASHYRLVTRSDFDGLVCGVLLKELDLIDEITFVHPKDMQDGKIAISARDITTNLPYVPGCHLAFDHHSSELERNGTRLPANYVIDPKALSAARVVWRHFGGEARFPRVKEDLMRAVDKADAAQFSRDDILNPTGWTLLSFLMDSRTGLGRFRNFGVSNYQLMMSLVDACAKHGVEEVLGLPDVAERVKLYREHQGPFKEQLRRTSTVHKNLVEVDLRNEETIYAGNRFVVYALNPGCNISMHVMWGREKKNVVFAIGKSILNKTSKTHVGTLCLTYGGGGHDAAGTCQVDADKAEGTRKELIAQITKDG